jgi:hypothetical protein
MELNERKDQVPDKGQPIQLKRPLTAELQLSLGYLNRVYLLQLGMYIPQGVF